MIQVAICDDESLVAHQLESIIWELNCNPRFHTRYLG